MNNSAESTEADAVDHVIQDVLETVSSFDGRLQFSRKEHAMYTLVFLGTKDRAIAEISSHFNTQESWWITLESSNDHGSHSITEVYRGSFDITSIRHALGQSLAIWYGDNVRSMHKTF